MQFQVLCGVILGLIAFGGFADFLYFTRIFLSMRKDVTTAFFVVSVTAVFVGSELFYLRLWFDKEKLVEFIQATSCTLSQANAISKRHRPVQIFMTMLWLAAHVTSLIHSLSTAVRAKEAMYMCECLTESVTLVPTYFGFSKFDVPESVCHSWVVMLTFTFMMAMMNILLPLNCAMVLTMQSYSLAFIDEVNRSFGDIPKVCLYFISISN